MKRIGLGLIALALWAAPPGRAQDAATEERLRKLSGQIEDLVATQDTLRVKIEELTKELASVREVQSRPAPVYVTRDDLKRLAADVNSVIAKVDARRVEDNQSIREELRKLARILEAQLATPPLPKRITTPTPRDTTSSDTSAPARGNTSAETSGGSARSAHSPTSARGNTSAETPEPPARFIKYTIGEGDTLGAIADACRKKGLKVTSKQIQDANPGLKPTALKVGKEIVIPLPPGSGTP
jgi:LysM repeat protein